MVRKAPATTKHKGSQRDETRMAGITDNADYLQQQGDPAGIRLDESVTHEAHSKSAKDVMDTPAGGEEERFMGRTNVPDYIVPSGVQLTENLIEEIVEGAQEKTPERPVEK